MYINTYIHSTYILHRQHSLKTRALLIVDGVEGENLGSERKEEAEKLRQSCNKGNGRWINEMLGIEIGKSSSF